jgi:hypothetical protein
VAAAAVAWAAARPSREVGAGASAHCHEWVCKPLVFAPDLTAVVCGVMLPNSCRPRRTRRPPPPGTDGSPRTGASPGPGGGGSYRVVSSAQPYGLSPGAPSSMGQQQPRDVILASYEEIGSEV